MLKRETSSPLDAIFPADISGIECGYVAVPLEHAKPAGPTIKLAVAILRAKAPIPDGDPLVMLQGGPGGGTIETYVTIMSASPLRATRDIVLFDQRGTGKSLPALKCPESIALTRASIEKTQDHETAARLSWEATQACHDRLAREGVNLSAFDSLENAADINSVREALGYARINLRRVVWHASGPARHAARAADPALGHSGLCRAAPDQLCRRSHPGRKPRLDRVVWRLRRRCALRGGLSRARTGLSGSDRSPVKDTGPRADGRPGDRRGLQRCDRRRHLPRADLPGALLDRAHPAVAGAHL
jgi:pimeloyl-ACP methyl ester carboxylesterase